MIASFLLFLHLISSLFRKCSPRGIQLPEKGGKEVSAERGWSYPTNHPCWLLCCTNMKGIPASLLIMNTHHATTLRTGLLLLRTTKVFLDKMAAQSYSSACCTPLRQTLFMLVSAGKYCTNTKRRPCDLFGSSVKAAGTLVSVVHFCNQATLSFPNYWYSQISNKSRG